MGPRGPDAAPSPAPAEVGLRARLGGLAVLLAVCTFGTVFGLSVSASGTAYVWHLNMISDLGDRSCHVRDHRWICSPGHGLFNTGLVLTGTLLAAAGGLLRQLWGRVLAGSVASARPAPGTPATCGPARPGRPAGAPRGQRRPRTSRR